jgi:uncharacterized membrane protein YuzA (DUF378 family)
MKLTNLSNVIYVIIQLSNMHTLEITLQAFMKKSNNTYVVFVTRALAARNILEDM